MAAHIALLIIGLLLALAPLYAKAQWAYAVSGLGVALLIAGIVLLARGR